MGTDFYESIVTAMAITLGVVCIMWVTATTGAEAWQGILSASACGLFFVSVSRMILQDQKVSEEKERGSGSG
jgi:hypothetical protein